MKIMIFILALVILMSSLNAQVDHKDWIPADLLMKINMTPLTALDQEIKDSIESYQNQIAPFIPGFPFIKKHLPKLFENITVLYREYNENHTRSAYTGPDFTVEQCLAALYKDMDTYLKWLKIMSDPDDHIHGLWCPKAFWLQGWGMMSRYEASLPSSYDPAVPTPVILSQQDNPDQDSMRSTPYIMIRNLKIGYQFDDIKYQAKAKQAFLDLAKDVHIDPFRIYTTGFSFGGQICLRHSMRYQHWYAASVPVHNDLNYINHAAMFVNTANLLNTPTRLVHGTNDSYYQDTLFKYMKAGGCPVEEFLFPTGHNADIPFRDSLILLTEFCDKHTLNPYPKIVQHTIEQLRYSRAFWIGGRYASGQSGTKFRVEVKNGNIIEITHADPDLVGFDFYLHPDLVDMSTNVKVMYSAQTLFDDMPQSKITVAIKQGTGRTSGVETLLWQELDSIRHEIFGYESPYTTPVKHSEHRRASDVKINVGPNPFNTSVTIKAINNVKVKIFNVNGELVHSSHAARRTSHVWQATGQPAGLYVVRVKCGNQELKQKLLLIK
jgi:predicted esterase